MLMPLPIHLAHRIVEKLAEFRQKELPWLRPDGKSQVTVEYVNEKPTRVHTVVVSTQHDESVMDKAKDVISQKAKDEIIQKVIRPTIPQICGTTTSSSTSTPRVNSSSAVRTATPV